MDTIIHDLLDTIAPLLVQILGAIVLALASAALLKARVWLDVQLSTQQRAVLGQLATTAVHLAEQEGLGKMGTEKAAIAQKYVDGELEAAGISTVKFGDLEAAVKGAVEAAWRGELGPTWHPETESPVSGPTVGTASASADQ
jgi:hypothetical protein